MSSLTISLADDDFAFLKKFSAAQGISPSEFLASQARNLRRQLEQPLPPEIVAATGIILLEAEPTTDLLNHLERKHQ